MKKNKLSNVMETFFTFFTTKANQTEFKSFNGINTFKKVSREIEDYNRKEKRYRWISASGYYHNGNPDRTDNGKMG